MRTRTIDRVAIAAAVTLVLWCRAAGADATPSFAGVMLDTSCAPLPGVTVTLNGGATVRGGVTGAGGEFSFEDLTEPPSGEYVLAIHAAGHTGTLLRGLRIPLRFGQGVTLPLRHGPSDTLDVFDDTESKVRLTSPETAMIDPTQTRIRIVAMGDSTTAGTPAFKSPREAPPSGQGDQTSQYAYWLMQAHPDWDVVNQGVNAQRSDVIAARFDDDVVARKPAVVVIIAGVNDVYQGRPAQHVTEQLAAMYQRARAAGIRVVAGTIIPYNTATADQNARMREINAWIRARADAGLVIFADTRAAVAAPGDPDKLASSLDGLHPDAAGYRKMANALAPAIQRALAAR